MGLTESILLISYGIKTVTNKAKENVEENSNFFRRSLNKIRTKCKERRERVEEYKARRLQAKKQTIYKYNITQSEMIDEFVKTPIPKNNYTQAPTYNAPVILELKIKDSDLMPAISDKTYVNNSFGERINPITLSCSTKGRNLIKVSEGCVLETYKCPAGITTIGYGHTKGVEAGDKITKETAEKYLDEDIQEVETFIRNSVTVPLTQNEFDALVSFGFNVGCGKLNDSTLLRKLNSGDYQGAAAEFSRWNKINKNGTFVVSQGLTNRREREKELFLS